MRAQSASSSISGSVLDTSTGKFLEGAAVSVEGTNLETTTKREGRFVLRSYAPAPVRAAQLRGRPLHRPRGRLLAELHVAAEDVATNQYYNEYQYQAPRETVDVRIDYKRDRRFTPYFQARNIFGRPIVMSTPILPFNHAEYGDSIYELRLRGTW